MALASPPESGHRHTGTAAGTGREEKGSDADAKRKYCTVRLQTRKDNMVLVVEFTIHTTTITLITSQTILNLTLKNSKIYNTK